MYLVLFLAFTIWIIFGYMEFTNWYTQNNRLEGVYPSIPEIMIVIILCGPAIWLLSLVALLIILIAHLKR